MVQSTEESKVLYQIDTLKLFFFFGLFSEFVLRIGRCVYYLALFRKKVYFPLIIRSGN